MVISVASGKGGTGKTLVATSLALSLSEEHKVTFLDCDVEEPNGHVFLKPALTGRETVNIPVPKVAEDRCTYCGKCAQVCAYHAIVVLENNVLTFPQLCHGCGACTYPEKRGWLNGGRQTASLLSTAYLTSARRWRHRSSGR